MKLKNAFYCLIGLSMVFSSISTNKVDPKVYSHGYATDIADDEGVLTYFDYGDTIYWSGQSAYNRQYVVSDMFENEFTYLNINISDYFYSAPEDVPAINIINNYAKKLSIQMKINGNSFINGTNSPAILLGGTNPIDLIIYGGTNGGILSLSDFANTHNCIMYDDDLSNKNVYIYQNDVNEEPNASLSEQYLNTSNFQIEFNPTPDGTHVCMWEDGEVISEPTCTSSGQMFYSCAYVDCNLTNIEEIPMTEHEYEIISETPSTCSQEGTLYLKCAREECGNETTVRTQINPTNHVNIGERYKEYVRSTCKTQGYSITEKYCLDCGEVTETLEKEIIDYSDHFWSEPVITKEATCKEKGEQKCTCLTEGCGETYTQEIPIDPDAHKNILERQVITNPGDCQTPATFNIEYYCPDCGVVTEVLNDQTSEELGDHIWDNGEVTIEATCQSEGLITFHCTVPSCNEIMTEVLDIDTDNHVNQNTRITNVVKPTCLNNGSHIVETYCVDCGTTIEVSETIIDLATGHNWNDGEIIKAPTCIEQGTREVHCSNEGCNEVETRTISIDPNNHTDIQTREVDIISSTCTNPGSYTLETYCAGCGAVISRVENNEIPATGHTWDNGTITASPTCSQTGTITHHCLEEGCDETYEEIIPIDPNAHDLNRDHWILKDFKAPTNVEEGYSGDYHCPGCDIVLETGHILEKLSVDDPFENVDDVEEIITDVVEVTDETKENLEDLIENDPETASDILDSVNDTGETLKDELNQGTITEEEYEEQVEVLQTILDTSAQIANNRSVAVANVIPLENDIENCQLDGALNIQTTVDDFYYNTLYDMLSKERNPSGRVIRRNARSLDLETDAETYKSAVDFIDYSVEKMCDLSSRLRQCSNESFVEHINVSVVGISYRSFRNFDKDLADQEFLEDAKMAVLLYLQEQALNSLKKAHKEEQKSIEYKGQYKLQLDKQYEEEVSQLENLETFNGIVIEAMRVKFVSIVEHRVSLDASYQNKANELLDLAKDKETFTPIYDEIFASWALNEELNPEYDGITLEVLTNEVITQVTGESKSIERRNGLTKGESLTFAIIFGSMGLVILSGLIYSNVKGRRVKNDR